MFSPDLIIHHKCSLPLCGWEQWVQAHIWPQLHNCSCYYPWLPARGSCTVLLKSSVSQCVFMCCVVCLGLCDGHFLIAWWCARHQTVSSFHSHLMKLLVRVVRVQAMRGFGLVKHEVWVCVTLFQNIFSETKVPRSLDRVALRFISGFIIKNCSFFNVNIIRTTLSTRLCSQ